MKKDNKNSSSADKTYKKPSLKKLGKFKELTQNKGGRKSDGAGKPRTRL